jgi:hypothetical protein
MNSIFKSAIIGTMIWTGASQSSALIQYEAPPAIAVNIKQECEKYGIQSLFVLEGTHENACSILDQRPNTNISRANTNSEQYTQALIAALAGSGILYLIYQNISDRRRKMEWEKDSNPLDFWVEQKIRSRVEPWKARVFSSPIPDATVEDEWINHDIIGPSPTLNDTWNIPNLPIPESTGWTQNNTSEKQSAHEMINTLLESYLSWNITDQARKLLLIGLTERVAHNQAELDENILRDIFLMAELDPSLLPTCIETIGDLTRATWQEVEDTAIENILTQIDPAMGIWKWEREAIYQQLAILCFGRSPMTQSTVDTINLEGIEYWIRIILESCNIIGYRHNGNFKDGINFENIQISETEIAKIIIKPNWKIHISIIDPITREEIENREIADLNELDTMIKKYR